jgi:hypothetical protein
MREFDLYSTQRLPHTILLMFALFVFILSKLPKMVIKPIKPHFTSVFSSSSDRSK